MPSTITCSHGQVVVVSVALTHSAEPKSRPALVVSVDGFHATLPDVIVCPISSRPRYTQNPGPGDHPLVHWQEVGLRHPSTVRISNLLAVEKSLVKRVLGTLHPADLARVQLGLRGAFGFS